LKDELRSGLLNTPLSHIYVFIYVLHLAHDAEGHALGQRPDGWTPVFQKDHAQTISWNALIAL
jgi:hypothetical protein